MAKLYILFKSGDSAHQDAVVENVMRKHRATRVNVGTYLLTMQRDNTFKVRGKIDRMLIDTLTQTLSQQLGQPVTVTTDFLKADLGARHFK